MFESTEKDDVIFDTIDFDSYQKKAHTFVAYPKAHIIGEDGETISDFPFVYPALALAEEAGEVAGKFAKAVRDCNGEISLERKDGIAKELGDVLWFVAELATLLDINLSTVAKLNIAKLASRKARGVISGDGDNR